MKNLKALIYSLKEDKAHLYDASVSKSLVIEKLHQQIAELEAPKTCEGCKLKNGCGIKKKAIRFLSWNNCRQCNDQDFGCNFYEPKAKQ